jgi:carbon storage regulator
MLVLSRKKNEQIVIDDHIVITVIELRGDKVRLGIEAPRSVPIHRAEVQQAIVDATRVDEIQQQIDHDHIEKETAA